MKAFTYHRALAPMLWVLAGLASIELLVTHLLVAHWFPRVALVLSVASLCGLMWLIRAIAKMRRRPVIVGPDAVLMAVGGFRCVTVPLGAIAGVDAAGNERDRSALNLALVAHPNVMLELRAPLPGHRRRIRSIAHRLDDPLGFIAAVRERLPGDQPATGNFTVPSASRSSGP